MRWFLLAVVIVFMFAPGLGFSGDSPPVDEASSPAPLAGISSENDADVRVREILGDSGQTLTDYDKRSQGEFAYAQEVENPGTRSAGVRGLLTFKGLRIRGYDGRRLRTPIGSFHYRESQLLWEPQGWFPNADIPFKAAEVRIDRAVLSSGSYKGERRIGTPEDWCYDPGVDTWYNPELLVIQPVTPRQ